jgi:hypothetical protein
MSPTRRRFAGCLLAAPAALAGLGAARALAQDEPPSGALLDPGNVFISPPGRPYRAKMGAPYPVADWFKAADTNADGKIDHAEFIADSLAFFKILDRNADGVISPQEVAFYEQRIAPEVLGMRVVMDSWGVIEARPRLWKTQMGGMGGGMGGGIPSGAIDPGGGEAPSDESARARPYDASGAGASPYSFFDEPEPVSAADIHFRGLISKSDFVTLAEAHFKSLDREGKGFLTLEGLPRTPVQRRLEHTGRRRR